MHNSDFLAEVYGDLDDDEYGWVCNFRASPEHGEWGGRAYRGTERQAQLIDQAENDNTYFCVSVLAGFNDSDKWVRQKSTFRRMAALVVDDVDPDAIIGSYSWALQTSPGKWQVGILLDREDPDCANLPLIDRLMQSLSARGNLGADKSGNAIVRYVRLPVGTNTKPRAAGPWRHQLAHWAPSVRWPLADAAHAVGVDLDALRVAQASSVAKTQQFRENPESVAGQMLALLSAPLNERAYHDAITRLSASFVAGGMFPGAAVTLLRSLMEQVKPGGPPEEVARWQTRYDEIPRAVKSAEQFAPPERAPAQITVNLSSAKPAQPSDLAPLDWSLLERTPPEPAEFRVAGWLPSRTTTLLSANGGVGKSNLALQLAVALASGQQWLGMDVMPSRVLVISAEDEARTVHFRVSNICTDVGVSLSALADRLMVYDMAQADCVLWGEQGMTPRMQWLADTVERHRAQVVIIDNSSDVFAANENDRAAVRGFMRALNTIAAGVGCANLLLAHVDKASVRMGAGLDTDSTFSGSTAWNNSARSRWAMVRDGEAIALRHEKCNLGPRQDELRLEFDANAKVFRRFGNGPASAAAVVVRNAHRAAILRMLADAERHDQRLSMNAAANNNAYRVLRSAPDFPRVERSEFFSLLFALQRDGLVEETEYKHDRKTFKRLLLTESGRLRAASGSGAPAMWRGNSDD